MTRKAPSKKHSGMPRGSDGDVKLSAKKTSVFLEPTLRQSQNDTDVRHIKEAALADMALQRYRKKHGDI